MSQVSDPFSTPELNGTFNNWCGDCNPMSDSNGDEVWEVTVSLNIGDTIEYKFSADNWTYLSNTDWIGWFFSCLSMLGSVCNPTIKWSHSLFASFSITICPAWSKSNAPQVNPIRLSIPVLVSFYEMFLLVVCSRIY